MHYVEESTMKKNIVIAMLLSVVALALVPVAMAQQYYTPGYYSGNGYYGDQSLVGERNTFGMGYTPYSQYDVNNQYYWNTLYKYDGYNAVHGPISYNPYSSYMYGYRYGGTANVGASGSKGNPIMNTVYTSSDAPDQHRNVYTDTYYRTHSINNENTNYQITPIDRIHHDTTYGTTSTTTTQTNPRQTVRLEEGE